MYHGPSISEEEARKLKVLRAVCQALFWICLAVVLVIPYSLTVPILIGLFFVGVGGLWGEIRFGGKLRHYHRSRPR